jgi:pyridoxine 5-phosphate synthase
MRLGVNIDHIAVLREARAINEPDPVEALAPVTRARADQITIHLREDRRHINEDDVRRIIEQSKIPVNLECSINDEIMDLANRLQPHRVTIVPEKREEVTTEGGLDLRTHFDKIYYHARTLRVSNIEVSLFIDPDPDLIFSVKTAEVDNIEIHTGEYANIHSMLYSNLRHTHNSIEELEIPRQMLKKALRESIIKIENTIEKAHDMGITVAAGHGLNYQNVKTIADIEGIEELNIGQSIIARSVFVGIEEAVREMREIINA